ncbi:MAG TPA: hypothetical protein VMV49_04010 [Candidatus Deferrimicrobium sp.]|nr:hypothetical protein [Candidatus Deferrimicrobium sp.]
MRPEIKAWINLPPHKLYTEKIAKEAKSCAEKIIEFVQQEIKNDNQNSSETD